ncbi:MAG: YggS family pyridoxal phosphate-dependent enzyme [Bacteroidia bacterium]|nr:YggS family pyridoxal phosphate-dependent enzyme [Bacteroidia bacterium]MCF8425256.1 YggS family pyridoxal phosphate-dependent enzyme [Bacteroidia bacterium]MCF8446522.1 YggS family pyridoxal phosphate-dependent enzyme [Bacteroidia bacterium]
MIAANIQKINQEIGATARLIAVSKTKPKELLLEAYEAGQRLFGENKVQEMLEKYQELPKDIEWHLIGHLQSNKVKYIAPFVSLIHSVDSYKLLETINKEALKNNRVIPVLLQIYIAQEDTKFGLNQTELTELLDSLRLNPLENIEIVGLMGMASNTENEELIRKEFAGLKTLFEELKNNYFSQSPSFKEISMGMSSDYLLAVKEGSTLVRVGSSIFGNR